VDIEPLQIAIGRRSDNDDPLARQLVDIAIAIAQSSAPKLVT
jgi:hypothetical protein